MSSLFVNTVAPQEEKNIAHGNICAKNLLLARKGDSSPGCSPFIKLSDPGINLAILGKNGESQRVILILIECKVAKFMERVEKTNGENYSEN